MEDITPIGGSWIQDIAYNIRKLNLDFENTDFCCSNSGETIYTGVTINVTQLVQQAADTIYISNPLPILPNTIVNYTSQIIKPTPKIIDISRNSAYLRCCGSAYGITNYFVECRRCVDKWLDEHISGFYLNELNPTVTGCSVKKPKPNITKCCCKR
jgi:hypothetical protein